MQPTIQRGTACRASSARQWKHPWPRRSRSAAVTAATLAFGACASVPVPASESNFGLPPVQVVVHNDGLSDVTVYAYRGDQRMRIGQVVAHGTETVTVPSGMAAPGRVQLMLHQVSGGDFVSDEVTLRPGEEHAEVRVGKVLDEAAIYVAPGRMP
jgi:hypothetical protein